MVSYAAIGAYVVMVTLGTFATPAILDREERLKAFFRRQSQQRHEQACREGGRRTARLGKQPASQRRLPPHRLW